MQYKLLSKNNPILLAIALSLSLSYFLNWIYQQPFNVDGILYLKIASLYLQEGFHTAMINFGWPFYAIFIAWIASLTHLSLQNAAFLLDALLITLLAGSFIALIKELGGNQRIQYWGTFVILIYPFLNHDRTNLLRDFGYYAFTLLSLLFFLRYLRQHQWRYAMSWFLAVAIATLFRIEGAFLLALAPFALLFQSPFTFKKRLVHFLQINCINILIFLVLIFYSAQHLPQLLSLWHNNYLQFVTPLFQKNLLLQITVLSPFSKNFSYLFLSAGLFAIYIATVISTLGILFSLLSLYGFQHKLLPTDKESRTAIITYVIINIIITAAFLLKYFFLSSRYLGTLCLILLLATPFSLDYIFRAKKLKTWILILLITWLIAVTIDGLGNFGTSKTYIVNAGQWLDKNTPVSSLVYSNDPQLVYYAHRRGMEYPQDFVPRHNLLNDIKKHNLQQYNYLAVTISHKTPMIEQQLLLLLNKPPLKIFVNSRGDKVLIYQLH